jgi:hypothetical protein
MTEETKFFAVDFEYIDHATWMGPAKDEQAAIEYLQNHLKENNIRGVLILGSKEIDNPLENEIQISRKRTIN